MEISMKLHQLLRQLRSENAVVILDTQGIIVCKECKKDNIDIDLYEYNVIEFGSAISEFYDIKSCIFIIIDK